jgi:peptidoglycan/LPS O-acetylase OafA/YrhL
MRDYLSIEQATRDVQGPRHSVELQSLRGIAALTVLFHHCTGYYEYGATWKLAAQLLLNAHAAVVLFFVLSGFVLTLSLMRKRFDVPSLADFYIRRAFRIYPAMWLACCIGLAYFLLFRHVPLPDWVSSWWRPSYREAPLTAKVLIATFLSYGQLLPIPLWSLFVELGASVLMPFIVFVLARGRWAFGALLLALLAFSVTIGPRTPFGIGIYLVDFAIGAGLVTALPVFAQLLKGRVILPAAIGAFLLLWFGRYLGGWNFEHYYNDPFAALIEALGAAALIGTVYTGHERFGLLRRPLILWFGDISYSLYLVHLPILGLVAGIGGEWLGLSLMTHGPLLGTLTLTVSTLVLSVAVAALSYRFLEVPMISLGKKVTAGTLRLGSAIHRKAIAGAGNTGG